MLEAIIMVVCLWVGYRLGRRRKVTIDAGTMLLGEVVAAAQKCKANSKFHGGIGAITLQKMRIEIEGEGYVLGVTPSQSGWQMVMEYKGVMHD